MEGLSGEVSSPSTIWDLRTGKSIPGTKESKYKGPEQETRQEALRGPQAVQEGRGQGRVAQDFA